MEESFKWGWIEEFRWRSWFIIFQKSIARELMRTRITSVCSSQKAVVTICGRVLGKRTCCRFVCMHGTHGAYTNSNPQLFSALKSATNRYKTRKDSNTSRYEVYTKGCKS